MLIWDDVAKGHKIRIRGQEIVKLEPAKLTLTKQITELNTDVETLLNKALDDGKTGYHCRMKINSKNELSKSLDYSLWLGPKDYDPANDGF